MDKRHTESDAKYQLKLTKLRKELTEALENELVNNITTFKRSRGIRNEIRITEKAQFRNLRSWRLKAQAKALRNHELISKQEEINSLNRIIIEQKAEASCITAELIEKPENKELGKRLFIKLTDIQMSLQRNRKILGIRKKQIEILKTDSTIAKEWKERLDRAESLALQAANITPIEDLEHIIQTAEFTVAEPTKERIAEAQRIAEEFLSERKKPISLKENPYEIKEY